MKLLFNSESILKLVKDPGKDMFKIYIDSFVDMTLIFREFPDLSIVDKHRDRYNSLKTKHASFAKIVEDLGIRNKYFQDILYNIFVGGLYSYSTRCDSIVFEPFNHDSIYLFSTELSIKEIVAGLETSTYYLRGNQSDKTHWHIKRTTNSLNKYGCIDDTIAVHHTKFRRGVHKNYEDTLTNLIEMRNFFYSADMTEEEIAEYEEKDKTFYSRLVEAGLL